MPEVRIRAAVSARDIASVRRLLEAYGEHLASHPAGAASICITGYDRELAQLPEGYDALLLATVDGEPAGCIALHPVELSKPSIELKRLWVGREFRGLGLGRRLIAEAIDWAEQAGFDALYLDTVPEAMPEANVLYRAAGFLPVEPYRDSDIPGVVFFRRSLNPKP